MQLILLTYVRMIKKNHLKNINRDVIYGIYSLI